MAEIKVQISIKDLPLLKELLKCIADMGVLQPDGVYCTCEKKTVNPMFKTHTKNCLRLDKAIKNLGLQPDVNNDKKWK